MRRCACGILMMDDDAESCSLCGPRIADQTILLIAGHLLGIGVETTTAFETAGRIALDLDARNMLSPAPCRYCGREGPDHEICRQQDERISELDALEDERASA